MQNLAKSAHAAGFAAAQQCLRFLVLVKLKLRGMLLGTQLDGCTAHRLAHWTLVAYRQ